MEGFEQNNSLSAEQQERPATLSNEIMSQIKKLEKTNFSPDSDEIIEEIRSKSKALGIEMTNQQIKEHIKELRKSLGLQG